MLPGQGDGDQQRQQPAVLKITPTKAELIREFSCPEFPLVCTLCNLPFRSTSNLRFHMVKTHRCSDPSAALAAAVSAAPEIKRYHCPEINCPYSELRGEFFTTLSRVKQHYSWKHVEKKSQCRYCSRRFPTDSLLGLHLRDCGRFFNCEECSRFYRDLKNLRSHFKKTGHGANSIFNQRQRRRPQCRGLKNEQRRTGNAEDVDLDDRVVQSPAAASGFGGDVSASLASAPAVSESPKPMNLVIVLTGLGGGAPSASVMSVSADAAAAAAKATAASSANASANANNASGPTSRYRPLVPRPLPTETRACQTDSALTNEFHPPSYLYSQQQPMLYRAHHHTGPVMVHDHASFRGSSCSNFAVVSFQDSNQQQQQQQQQQSTMHTQTEYTSPIATDGYSVGVQYSYQQQQQQQQATQSSHSNNSGITQGVCVGSGASPPITLGIQAGPDPLEQLLDMETQTNDAFGSGFAGCEMETQTYEEFDWETVFGIVNRRSTGVG
ncbi:hypothetical protein BOX15_Mlig017066g1 [Macrostomum lignano]|uniref:C2H2-type domain-containing protein n=1 Tax=Macrostomum lignano TaxID=282301 RepID=A0A267E9K5_9PLAT|nr:hypothetical protein BOX15_Mlig017066g1 [Macrostomum lignano]